MPSPRTLLAPGFDGWRMAGEGGFDCRGDGIAQSSGGPGLLWYAAESFADFVLEVSWRTTGPGDNSGVFVRSPPLPDSDIEPAIRDGYEVQIDERGFDPQSGQTGSPLHLTGAIYKLAPAVAGLSRGIGQWNDFRIEARGSTLRVHLNGRACSRLSNGSRARAGHIALQCHHEGSAVQFRALRITPLEPEGR